MTGLVRSLRPGAQRRTGGVRLRLAGPPSGPSDDRCRPTGSESSVEATRTCATPVRCTQVGRHFVTYTAP